MNRLLVRAAWYVGVWGLVLGALGINPARAEAPPKIEGALPLDWIKPMTWRSIGPANMGGRITAIAVYEKDPSLYYVATASGGLLKTINNGVTFEHQFDKEATVSIGDVCVAPSNANIVWVGTGENNPRNSVSFGDGVYKSTDGGKSWKNMGLKKTFQIGKIAIHPKNPDIVYVGALGRLYGPNPERGVFKTTDGGKTWDKVFFLDENTGVIDMVMHPKDPETLLVAAWERRRDGFDSYLGKDRPESVNVYDPIVKWGPKAGIYKTVDGGKKFHKVAKGLPTNAMGRIGLDYYRTNPNVVFAIIDCEKIGMGKPPPKVAGNAYLGISGEDVEDAGARLTNVAEGGPADKAGLKVGDIIQAVNKKKTPTFQGLIEAIGTYKPKDKVKLLVLRDKKSRPIDVVLGQRPVGKGFGPGTGTKSRPYHAFYGGQAANKQDEQGPDGHEYGGVYKSSDGGESWVRVNSVNPRPMYFSQVRVDPSDDKYVYVLGIALYMSENGGKSFQARGGFHVDEHALWINPKDGRHMVVGTDGGHYVTYDRMKNWDHLNHLALGQFYHVAVCTKRPYWVYGGLQDNGTWGGPSLGQKGGMGPINEDWVSIFGGDGYVCRVDPADPDLIYFEMQDGGMGRRHLKTGEFARIAPPSRDKKLPPHRFNWNTPYILSHHNPKIFYCGGEFVFRSVKRGDDLRIISPEITLTNRGSATALAESAKYPDVLWAGTDDGALWVTRDGGKNWTELSAKVGLPGPRWVSTIEASRFKEGRAYVAFDAHRSDDDEPYLYVTEDFGETWKSLRGNLPAGSTRCLREDVVKENLLYLGTEFAVFASIDRGGTWTRLNNNLPTVAVHEIAVHPTAGEIVAATHGRSLWILDVTTLRQIASDPVKTMVANDQPWLFKPATAVRWHQYPAHGRTNRRFVGQNPPSGAQIFYYLPNELEKETKLTLQVLDIEGFVVRKLQVARQAGMHKVSWDLNRQEPPKDKGKIKGKDKPPKGTPPPGPGPVPPGTYRIVLQVAGQEFAQTVRVEADPNLPRRSGSAGEEE